MNINEFKDAAGEFQRPTLFEVIFHNASKKDHLKFVTYAVHLSYWDGEAEVEFYLYENECHLVRNSLDELAGPITIIEYKRDGDVSSETNYVFKMKKATTELNWGHSDKLKTWAISGILV